MGLSRISDAKKCHGVQPVSSKNRESWISTQGCTVEDDLPREIDYLRRHDEALRRIMDAVEMPDRLAENPVMFIRQNNGPLPPKRRKNEFQRLRDDEVALIEKIVNDVFSGFEEPRRNSHAEGKR